jgi:predicted unusual protein kinase regulating ubiquinone biosynthesis (AarF/ABC1/UbiB family)
VAVKLLRPGLTGSVRQDLALLESLLAPLSAAFPALDAAALVRQVRRHVLDELDLEHEAESLRRFHRALRRHESFVVPRPITRLAHEGVLVEQWIDGTPLASAGPSEADAACRLLVRFVAGGLREGMVHADPDPRDVLVLDAGRIAILDFGAVAEPESARVDALVGLVEAFASGDEAAVADALEQLGSLPRELAGDASELARGVLGEFAEDAALRLDGDAVIRLRDRMIGRPRELAGLLPAGSIAPQDLWPARALGQLFSTIARVGATGNWREELRAALREGWSRA